MPAGQIASAMATSSAKNLHAPSVPPQLMVPEVREFSEVSSAQANADRIHREKAGKFWSFLVTIGIHGAILVALALWVLPALRTEVPKIRATTIPSSELPTIQAEVQSTTLRSKPSSPSASTRLITATSPAAIFIPQVTSETTFVGIGNGTGLGLGFGSGGGNGQGGTVTFFGQKAQAKRVAFVIDYSMSMNGKRDALMRKELISSLKKLPGGTEYALIFFAGPAWLAGDKIPSPHAKKKSIIKARKGGKTWEWKSPGSANNWSIVGRLPKAKWLKASQTQINSSVKDVRSTPLVWGTDWDAPLKIALEMAPRPDAIFFMTDGVSGGRSASIAKDAAKNAVNSTNPTRINCIIMMEPKARGALEILARETGGQMTIVNGKGGRKLVVKPK